MHRKLFNSLMVVALVGGLLAFAAVPANAAPPFDTQNFYPDDTVDPAVSALLTKNKLSDRFDGTDQRVHLTNVSTPDTERVVWFACPSGTIGAPGQTFGGAGAQALLTNCTHRIGEDTTGVQPPGGNTFAPTDEAYEFFWDIPGTLDLATVDILALACIGAGEDVESEPGGAVANCRGDIENDVQLDDSQTGAIADQTSSGEMISICTADVTGGPGSGNTFANEPCVVDPGNPGADPITGDQGPATGQQLANVEANFRPFVHGAPLPNNGFVFRATTSDDVVRLQWVIGPGDAQTDPNSAFDGFGDCELLQLGTGFKRWECVVPDASVVDNQENYLEINERDGGSGLCAGDAAGFVCALDVHYGVSSERAATAPARASFGPAPGGGGTPSTNAGCLATDVQDKDETNPIPTGEGITDANRENVEICLTDQFGNFLVGAPVTFESAGPEGSGFETCGGTTQTGTGAQPRLHDHNNDGRFEHCHTTTNAQGQAFAVIANFTDFTQTARAGDQTITACHDPDFLASAAPTAQPAAAGCGDTQVKDTVVKHWVARPSHLHLFFSGTGVAADPCHSGDTFKENVVGDTDNLTVCSLDPQDNNATTAQNTGGRLQWFIIPSGGGELTATRFVGNPPNETDENGRQTVTIEAFRQGNDTIFVCLQSDTGASIGPLQAGSNCASVQKRVTQGTTPSPPPGTSPTPPGGTTPPPPPNVPVQCRDAENSIVGTPNDDVITGTEGDDIICALAGDDTVDGLGGNDIILGGRGNDEIKGGTGNDAITGGGGKDSIQGDDGNDAIDGNQNNDVIIGGKGRDAIRGNRGNDTLRGSRGTDTLQGGADNDILKGGGGGDTLKGFRGDDDLDGGGSVDQCRGGAGRDTIIRCEL